jgi:tight adherence protein B
MTVNMDLIAALAVGAGLSLLVSGWLLRLQRRQLTLAEMLDLEEGERDVPVQAITESPEAPPVGRLTVRMGEMLGHLDSRGSLTQALQRAEMPVKAGEFIFLAAAACVFGGVLGGLLTRSPVGGIVAFLLVAGLARYYPIRRSNKRIKKMRAQLPHAFSLIASSVISGHTFLRSIQLLGDQIPEPLSKELQRVTAEVTLGNNLIDALDHMAERVQIVELHWAVKAVRIQQTVGGQLGEILQTLADFMRTREEVHREVTVLAAEGKFSGYVLIGLPFVVTAAMLLMDGSYFKPMLRGWGLVALGFCGALLFTGYLVIRKMVKIEV